MHVHPHSYLALLTLTVIFTNTSEASPPRLSAVAGMAVVPGVRGRWTETFDRLNSDRWISSNSSGFWQTPGLAGTFQPENDYVDGKGHLVLALKVRSCATGLCAAGAELQSTQRFGFGRYTYVMRAASTSTAANTPGQVRPGNISGAFSYLNNSTTEIDVEIEGNHPRNLDATVWKGLTQNSSSVLPASAELGQKFHTYSYEWRPDRIIYFMDGARLWETIQHIPQSPAYIMLNIWPTLADDWGGVTTAGTVYMLVDSVTFEPLP